MINVCRHLRLCRGCSCCRSSWCWPRTAGRRRKRRQVDLGPKSLRGDRTSQKMGSITASPWSFRSQDSGIGWCFGRSTVCRLAILPSSVSYAL